MKRSVVAAALFAVSTMVDAGPRVPLRDLVSGNNDRIRSLSPGMSRSDVVRLMKDYTALTPGGTVGNPYRAETFRHEGATYEVLYYLTQRPQPMQPREAPTTPVILKNGAVSGWGLEALRSLRP